jgi:histidine triad (HIT) family protein
MRIKSVKAREVLDSRGKMCEFCRIASKDIRASCVYEDDYVMAFLDNRPASDGHTLVIPKKHFELIYDIPDEEIAYLFKIVKKVPIAVRETVNPDGLTIIQRNGKAAGQHIQHLHVHIIPRYRGQRLLRMEEIPEASIERLDDTASLLRQHL